MTVTKLEAPGTTGRTPEGRQSWKDAQNQARGNLNWMLSFMDGEEIVAKLVDLEAKSMREEVYPVSRRYQYLKRLDNYLEDCLEKCREEKERLEEHADPQDLEHNPCHDPCHAHTQQTKGVDVI